MSGSNICFVANYGKTQLFDAVAQRIQEDGVRVFWVVVNRWLRERLEQTYGRERVQYLSRGHADKPAPPIGEFKIRELVYGDRVLVHEPDLGVRFLTNIQQPIYEFLKDNGITHVFGELTWAYELLIYRMCRIRSELHCRYLLPASVRIPNGRFALFCDEYGSEMIPATGSSGVAGPVQSGNSLPKPDYLRLNDIRLQRTRSLRARLDRVRRFITEENIDRDDPTHIPNRWVRFKLRTAEEINRELYHLVKRVPLAALADRKFVFYALHKQPEASIDVIGRYYEDQYMNIVNIWRILPADWALVVKEHTNAIGDRSLGFYRRVQRLPGVFILDEHEDSHKVIRQCELVVTVSGTVAYEAALLNKKAVTFAPTFFAQGGSCRHIGLNDLRNARDIYELTQDVIEESPRLKHFVLEHSFPGIISDPLADPRCMAQENISNVARAIVAVTASGS